MPRGRDRTPAGQLAAPALPAWLAALLLVLALLLAYLTTRCLTGTRAEERGHVYSHSFGSPGSGEGQFDEPWDVAVNETLDDIYVVDHANNRVEIFHETPAGTDEYIGQFNGSGLLPNEGTEAGAGGEPGEIKTGLFNGPTQIAIDNSCHYHKLTGTACEKYDPSNGDIYLIDLGHFVIDKYTPTGKYITQITGSENGGRYEHELDGVAVGTNGELLVASVIHGSDTEPRIFYYDNAIRNGRCQASCSVTNFEPTAAVSGFLGEGLAVNAEGDTYLHLHHLSIPDLVAKYSPSGLLLEELEVSPSGVAVEAESNDLYLGAGAEIKRYSASGLLLEQLDDAGQSDNGLAVDGATGTVFASSASRDLVNVFALEPPGPPTVKDSEIVNVTASAAQATAEVNPRGAATTYEIRYGPCGTASDCATSKFIYSVPANGLPAGKSWEPASASVALTGLAPATTYHFEVTARNEVGGGENTIDGEEIVFRTPAGGRFGLLDNRSWEQVTPPSKYGALFEPINQAGIIEAAANGAALTYLATNPTESTSAGAANAVQVLSERESSGKWSTVDIATSHAAPTGSAVGGGEEYRFFSADLSEALAEPFGEFTTLSLGATAQTPYVRSNFVAGRQLCTGECYRPLVTACPLAGTCPSAVESLANVPSGTVFSLVGKECEEAKICGPEARAASSNLGAIVLESKPTLKGLTLGEGEEGGLYEWTAGHLNYVGPRPAGGRSTFIWTNNTGTRVIVGAEKAGGSLQAVDAVTHETVELDEGEACGECEASGAEDPVVVGEGKTVFFRDKRALTKESDRGAGAADLYVCEIPATKVECVLRDLTPKTGNEPANILGIVAAEAGSDKTTVYVVANGALTPKAVKGSCSEEAIAYAGECNLYEIKKTEGFWGSPRLVAVLSGRDSPDWQATLNHHTARVAGAWLVFMSSRSLTGYDNRDIASSRPDEEVFAYDSEGSGNLACVSCSPTGERPHGVEYAKLGLLASGDRVWSPEQWIAASVPGWTPFALDEASYQSRYLGSEGRVFFDSSDDLTAGDGNGSGDVYEWEPAGVGSCTVNSMAYSSGSGGCLGLVSSGGSGEESGFLDASADGADVYFLTAAKLAANDTDDAVDIYDAHECAVSAPCQVEPTSPRVECNTGESCRPYLSAGSGVETGVASEVFSGFGNALSEPATLSMVKVVARGEKLARALKVCRSHRTKRSRRIACEVRARKTFGAKRR